MDRKDFSTREWFLVTILLSVIQGCIWYVSFVNSENTSALTYVSFAGTLISIILAVLAIGYTYGESLGQKNKSDNVSSQIAVLNEVVKNIKFESQSLEHISTISEELTRFSSKFESEMTTTKKTVDKVSTSIDCLLKDYDKYNSNGSINNQASQNINKTEVASAIMSMRTPLMEICILCIISAKGKAYHSSLDIVDEHLINYIEKAKKNFSANNNESLFTDGAEKLFTGAFLSVTAILKGVGLISIDDEKEIFISDELISEIKKTTIAAPKASGPFYSLIREEIVKDLSL